MSELLGACAFTAEVHARAIRQIVWYIVGSVFDPGYGQARIVSERAAEGMGATVPGGWRSLRCRENRVALVGPGRRRTYCEGLFSAGALFSIVVEGGGGSPLLRDIPAGRRPTRGDARATGDERSGHGPRDRRMGR